MCDRRSRRQTELPRAGAAVIRYQTNGMPPVDFFDEDLRFFYAAGSTISPAT
jgi:hypothetical protein